MNPVFTHTMRVSLGALAALVVVASAPRADACVFGICDSCSPAYYRAYYAPAYTSAYYPRYSSYYFWDSGYYPWYSRYAPWYSSHYSPWYSGYGYSSYYYYPSYWSAYYPSSGTSYYYPAYYPAVGSNTPRSTPRADPISDAASSKLARSPLPKGLRRPGTPASPDWLPISQPRTRLARATIAGASAKPALDAPITKLTSAPRKLDAVPGKTDAPATNPTWQPVRRTRIPNEAALQGGGLAQTQR